MTVQSKRELDATRKKLKELESLYLETEADDSQGDYARQLTLRSLRSTINQLKEEIVRFEAHAGYTSAD